MINKRQNRILITGASGMLGSRLTEYLSGEGFDVVAQYNANPTAVPDGPNISKISFDLTKLQGKINAMYFDAIVHCAAVTDVNFCEGNKPLCEKVNVGGTENILKIAQKNGCPLIYISTPMVFSGRIGGYKEDDKPSPPNYYGKTKMMAEKKVLRYKNGLVLRINPIGKRQLGSHPSFIQWFVEMASNNRSFNLFSDVIINPISTDTAVSIVGNILRDFRPGILHIGSRDKVNKAEIWNYIVKRFPEYTGKVTKTSVNKTYAGKIANRPHKMWLDVTKAENCGYKMPKWRNELDLVLRDLRVL